MSIRLEELNDYLISEYLTYDNIFSQPYWPPSAKVIQGCKGKTGSSWTVIRLWMNTIKIMFFISFNTSLDVSNILVNVNDCLECLLIKQILGYAYA